MANNGLIIVLGTFLVASAPAGATSSVGNAQTRPAGSADASKNKKYCLKETDTGTRLASKDCRTKAEWAREGIDIEEFVKSK
jgi:hypothetical protein